VPLSARAKMWWKLVGLALLAGAALFVLLAPIATHVTVELVPAGSYQPPKIYGDAIVKAKLGVTAVVGLIALAILFASVWAGCRVVRNRPRSEPN